LASLTRKRILDRKTGITEFTGAVSENGDKEKRPGAIQSNLLTDLLCSLWSISMDSKLYHPAAVVDLGVPAHAEIPCNPERLMHCQLKNC
jgi:hypothetical protein